MSTEEVRARKQFELRMIQGVRPQIYCLIRLAGGDYLSGFTQAAWEEFYAGWQECWRKDCADKLKAEVNLRQRIVDFVNREFFSTTPETEDDGFGMTISTTCPECGLKLHQIVRPGKSQCGLCG